MPLNLIKFFQPSYFFNPQPAIYASTVKFLVIVFGVIIIISVVIKIIQRSKKREHFLARLLNMYFSCLVTMGLVGLILTWFRYERVYYLAGRYMLFFWLLGIILWLAYILKYKFKVVPAAQEQLNKKQVFDKYLPHKK